MRDRILAELQARFLTTSDAAKALGLSRSGVRKLVRRGDLRCERTRSGQWIFHIGDVQRCSLQRADDRTRSREAVLARIHLKMAKAGIEPQQLSFFHGVGLRIVARGERPVRDRAPKPARSFDEHQGSEKHGYVERKAAG